MLSDGEQPAHALRELVKSYQITPPGKGEGPGCHVGEFVGICGDAQQLSINQIRFEEQGADWISEMADWPAQQF